MSEKANRGNEAEVAASAALDAEAAARFAKRREATLVENEVRRQRRDTCLRDSALTGAGAGAVGGSLALRAVRSATGTGPFRTLLGINMSAKAIGGAGQAFVVFVGFFMPFTFVANVTRWRCQKAGLKLNTAPKKIDYAT